MLISSYTHAAVDNLAMKLMECGLGSVDQRTKLSPMVRIGKTSACHSDVHEILASNLASRLDRKVSSRDPSNCNGGDHPSSNSLRKVVSSARIVCTTALSIPRSPLLAREDFDVVIVDEAGQISQPAIIGALAAADSFVLVGDHLQLPPLVQSEAAEQGGKSTCSIW